MLDIAGITPPQRTHLDGRSIVPLLEGKQAENKPIFIHFPHNKGILNAACTSVRHDNWKLIRYYGAAGAGKDYYELFNLKDDPQEAINLTKYYPKRVQLMNDLIDCFLEETAALTPIVNLKYAGKEFPPVRIPTKPQIQSSDGCRPKQLRLEQDCFSPIENGFEVIQLLDEKGVKRKSTAVVLQGQRWVSVENLADGKVKVTWDISKKDSPSVILFGWCGGYTASDINGWTLGPYKMIIQ